MASFLDILTADDAELLKIFYRIQPNSNDDFIIRINNIASNLGLNHTQLICSLAFNQHIEDMTDIHSLLGFRSYKVLAYRNEELFITDAYFQLAIDNILDIYSALLEESHVMTLIRKLLPKRLAEIETTIQEKQDPTHIMSYRMEINSIYNMGIANKSFADDRIQLNIGQHRINSGELKAMIEAGHYPVNNLFFMDAVSPLEKRYLIDEIGVPREQIINRLQNQNISEQERNVLEDCI